MLKVNRTKNLIALIKGVNANTKNLTKPATFIDTGKNKPSDYYQANVIRSPLHSNQESTSQLRLEKVFDQGSLSIAFLEKK